MGLFEQFFFSSSTDVIQNKIAVDIIEMHSGD